MTPHPNPNPNLESSEPDGFNEVRRHIHDPRSDQVSRRYRKAEAADERRAARLGLVGKDDVFR